MSFFFLNFKFDILLFFNTEQKDNYCTKETQKDCHAEK